MPLSSTRSTSPLTPDPSAPATPPLTRREAREREGRIRADAAAAAAPTQDRAPEPATARPASAPAPLHPAGEFASRRDRRLAEEHRSRAEPARTGSSFFRPSRRHLVLALSGGLVLVGAAAGVNLTVGASGSSESAAASGSVPTATPATVPVLPAATASARVVLSDVSTTSGTVAGGTSVTISGSNLDEVASVRFGEAEGSVAVENPDRITVTAPPASGQTEGVVPVALLDAEGQPITFDAVTDSVAAATIDPAPAAAVQPAVDTTAGGQAPADLPTPSAAGVLAATKVVASALTFAYTPDPALEAAKAAAVLEASRLASQLDYLETYWRDYNSAQYGVIGGNDCVNFTSQSLVARGWQMDGEWSYSAASGYSTAWASSTAFNSYLAAHPERATPLSNAQRDQVKVGDVVQFDWDGSGDWDHTGVVTTVDGDAILYASHTADNFDQSIDSAGAKRIMFWSI